MNAVLRQFFAVRSADREAVQGGGKLNRVIGRVAVSWSGYVTNLLTDAGVHFPAALTGAPIGKGPDGGLVATGAIVNVPAVLVIAALSAVCYYGVRLSAHANSVMVYLKVVIIVVFV